MKSPHVILELANVHNGDVNNIIRHVKEFSGLDYNNLGIKFQTFKYDNIALPDHPWYNTYKELFISENDWSVIIDLANGYYKKIWLDLFDLYGVNILKNKCNKIHGIKIQASVIENYEVFDALKSINLNEKELILNISGYNIKKITKLVSLYEKSLNVGNIILQIGFQAFPTKIEDTALNKIYDIKKSFDLNKICFTDHVSAEDDFARRVPLIALSMGCDLIEKHVCINRAEAKYDFHSALEYTEMKEVINDMNKLILGHGSEFINKSEIKYLVDSIQKPILKCLKKTGQLISPSELIYRRTNLEGINANEIKQIQKKHYILNKNKAHLKTVTKGDFHKAKIGVIVACRMKSARLKEKAIEPIFGIPSVERCLENCLKIPYSDITVLATSTLKQDAVLREYTLNGRVKFWQGDPDDVIKRYIKACEYYNIDVIIRVTGDEPVVSPEIAEYLLKSHFSNGADYTCPNDHAVGTGCEIYNTESLNRVLEYKKNAKYSEYMTFYMQNNKEIFKVNSVDLPKNLIRPYRLTLDYHEDLLMFENLFEKLYQNKMDTTLNNVFEILDRNPSISKINNHLTLAYKTDTKLIDKLNKVTKI